MQRRLSPESKKYIGLQAISESNVSYIAQQHNVSRNSVYAQKDRVLAAVDDAFMDTSSDDKILFHIPVTKAILQQVVLGIRLICKGSYRSIQLFLQDVFDTKISLGTLYNIHEAACEKAAEVNSTYDLASIQQSASDEIYHRNKPFLAVVDIHSRYCASLTSEDTCDTETWSVHLLDLINQGFNPAVNISDQGQGMKRAFQDVLPDTEHRFDHFHMIKALKDIVRYLKNQKESALTQHIRLDAKMERAKVKSQGQTLSTKLFQARRYAAKTEALYRHVSTLCSWLQHDILQLPGHNPDEREMLFDFILEELWRVASESHRIEALATSLTHQKSNLLAVSHALNGEFQQVASRYGISTQDVWDICYVMRYDIQSPNYHNQADALASRLGSKFDAIEDEVLMIMAATPRCSSMVENFNSRLRPYLDPRKQITGKSLDLIRFYLNHQIFLRSQHAYMQGKTPSEVLTGNSHPNWLTMLGFERFKKAA